MDGAEKMNLNHHGQNGHLNHHVKNRSEVIACSDGGMFYLMKCTIVSIAFFVATFTAHSQQWSNNEISALPDLFNILNIHVMYSRMTWNFAFSITVGVHALV